MQCIIHQIFLQDTPHIQIIQNHPVQNELSLQQPKKLQAVCKFL